MVGTFFGDILLQAWQATSARRPLPCRWLCVSPEEKTTGPRTTTEERSPMVGTFLGNCDLLARQVATTRWPNRQLRFLIDPLEKPARLLGADKETTPFVDAFFVDSLMRADGTASAPGCLRHWWCVYTLSEPTLLSRRACTMVHNANLVWAHLVVKTHARTSAMTRWRCRSGRMRASGCGPLRSGGAPRRRRCVGSLPGWRRWPHGDWLGELVGAGGYAYLLAARQGRCTKAHRLRSDRRPQKLAGGPRQRPGNLLAGEMRLHAC